MKRNLHTGGDDELRQVLRQWNVDATPSPRFQENVWKRIARSTPETRPNLVSVFAARIESLFRSPALATSYLGVLLFLGTGLGYMQANHTKEEARSQFQSMYVQSVDPYQMPGNSL
jgi:hypothetical protein